MTLRTMLRTELGARLGYLDEDGRLSSGVVADLLRAPLTRWGLSPRRAVLKHARDQLRAGDVEDVSAVPHVLQQLVDIGECDEVYVGHESYLAPAAPRWVVVGEGVAAYLGVGQPPEGVAVLERGPAEVVRRVRVQTDEDAAILEVAGAREVSLDEWLTPLAYLRHAARRLRRPALSDTLHLRAFWNLLEQSLIKEGLTLSADAEVRCVAGEPGGFFGRHDSPDPQGRWTVDPPDGLWCGYRRGYGDTHWHPCVVAVAEADRRALDLYNHDEWRWALLARGRHLGSDEIIQREGTRVQLTFPPPAQLQAAMDLLGAQVDAWAWKAVPGAPAPWEHIR